MRWSNLTADRDDAGRLPGMSGAPVVRTFDAPEALGINFHEVHARSAINDVPPMAHVDFRHTINPYRGCSHGCSYCMAGDTRVLRGDGTTARLAELQVGDEIYGTRPERDYRRWTRTRVLAHWSTRKRAYKVTLHDGTELVASGDHRFLTVEGWKYVTANPGGSRPSLAAGDRIMARAGWDSGCPEGGPEGQVLVPEEALAVASIRPTGAGETQLFDITTGSEDFLAEGVVSHNCFARPTHEYLGFDGGEDFRRQIVVKVNLPEVLRAELRRPSWKGEHIALGTNTDPYQWVESRYRITRGVWEQLLEARNPCSILTRSPLLLRDLDLFRELNEVTEFAANLSIPTVDEKAWRLTEPASPNPLKRVEALAELTAAGIRTGVLVAPLLPGINDSPAQVERVLELCGEAGADRIGGIALHLRGPLKPLFMDWLRQYRPDLVERYERLYGRGSTLPQSERRRLQRMIRRGRMQTPGAVPAGREGRAIRAATEKPAREAGTDATTGPGPAGPPDPVPQTLF